MTEKRPELAKAGLIIEADGSFNPSILQPAWFSHEKLLGPDEAQAATIEVIHPHVASIQFIGFSVFATSESFQIRTSQQPYYPMVRDLAAGVFRILAHTPIENVRISWDAHYKLENEGQWHSFGHLLAPEDHWKSIIKMPTLQRLVMGGEREDKGSLIVAVGPSKEHQPGLYFRVSDHFEIAESRRQMRAGEFFADLLRDRFDDSKQRSDRIVGELLAKVT